MLAVGKPSSRPRSSPFTTSPSIRNGAPSPCIAPLDVAGEHERADARRRDRLAVGLDQRDDPGLELVVRLEHVLVALGLGAEAEVLADRDVRRAELSDQDVVDELLGRDLRELLVERDDDQLGDAEACDHVALRV